MPAPVLPTEDAWNPGLVSAIPAAYRPLASMYRPESITNDLKEIDELAGFSGLSPDLIVEFRAERLIAHEALIRMTADVEVADGPNYEDLGLTFRAMLRRVLSGYVMQHEAACAALLREIKQQAKACVLAHLAPAAQPTSSPSPPSRRLGFLSRLRGAETARTPPPATDDILARIALWRAISESAANPIEQESLAALVVVASAIAGRFGRLVGEPGLIAELAARIVCNDYGSTQIGAHIDAAFRDGVEREGFRLLPQQPEPYIMNIKGASASGKSSMRPLQKRLAERLGVPWSDFSLISPDIWRKFLLDYESLGSAFKYAGALTAHELEIIDHKLDRYIAAKNASGRLSHLLIDRFRFDSFIPEAEVQVNSRLLTRFGSHVFMHFMITPPEATVERAWLRGLKVGRYKAVDDLLAHNIEAFSGMPELFFTWALHRKKQVHYEFLDNSVPHGEPPATVAFGCNGELNILDVTGILKIERYKRIDITARTPQEVYPASTQGTGDELGFLKRCIALLPVVNFADRKSGRISARFADGILTHLDREGIEAASLGPEARRALEIVLDRPRHAAAVPSCDGLPRLDPATADTIGRWGDGGP
jgi:hypothetical protein